MKNKPVLTPEELRIAIEITVERVEVTAEPVYRMNGEVLSWAIFMFDYLIGYVPASDIQARLIRA